MRKHYIDNIRWVAILIVLLFHSLLVFNRFGFPFNITRPDGTAAMETVMLLLNPWVMSLLFILAGVSTRYSLAKRSVGQYVKERFTRLLLPFIAAKVLLAPLQQYLFVQNVVGVDSGSLGNFLRDYLSKYSFLIIIDSQQFWFLLALFLISLLALFFIKVVDKNERFYQLCGKATLPVLLLLYFPLLASNYVCNFLTVFTMGLYFFQFMIGYFVLSHEAVQELLKRNRFLLLGLSVALGAVMMFFLRDGFTFDMLLNLSDFKFVASMRAYGYVISLAIIGCAATYFNQTNALTKYMSKASWGLYLVHQVLLIYIADFLLRNFSIPAFPCSMLIFVLTLASSVLAYEIIRRIPGLRYIFGIAPYRKKPKEPEKQTA